MKKETRAFSRSLRKNATKEEDHLWYDFLRTYPLPFRRQVPFGRYILNFYCAKANLGIELDGSQHYEDREALYDADRSCCLEETYGLHILRFTNLDIWKNFEGVCLAIDMEVKRYTPSSDPVCALDHLPPCVGKAEEML